MAEQKLPEPYQMIVDLHTRLQAVEKRLGELEAKLRDDEGREGGQ